MYNLHVCGGGWVGVCVAVCVCVFPHPRILSSSHSMSQHPKGLYRKYSTVSSVCWELWHPPLQRVGTASCLYLISVPLQRLIFLAGKSLVNAYCCIAHSMFSAYEYTYCLLTVFMLLLLCCCLTHRGCASPSLQSLQDGCLLDQTRLVNVAGPCLWESCSNGCGHRGWN